MNNHHQHDRELRFVLRHYQKHKFDTRRALREIRPRPLRRVAAVVVMAVAFGGAYALYHHIAPRENDSNPAPRTSLPAPREKNITQQPPAFHFENTPINEALREIGRRYGVELTASDTTRCITGDFETDDLPTLIDMIEQTLDIDIQP